MGSSTRLSRIFKRDELLRASKYANGVPTAITTAMLTKLVTRESLKAVSARSLLRLERKLSCCAALTNRANTGRTMNRV